ncbi:NYN domain-containing protein [Patescibacteria group bacterium]|nr:NYN domain-containing protein [Patescibacteria group bacterium]MBU1885668.1 NYN domain-containing protein [Patescibacteria group bacterium]
MNKREITKFLKSFTAIKPRTMVIIDFANVDKWEKSLNWTIGIKKLGQLIKHFSQGKKYLRRFYYGRDYGPNEKSTRLKPWSKTIHTQAQYNGFEIITKRVKYIHDSNYSTGYTSKCNLDIEMAVDLIKEKTNYDTAIIFSGDGDLAYVCRYLNQKLNKKIYIFGVRNHIGRELIDAKKEGTIEDILFAEDFEYRLNLKRNT